MGTIASNQVKLSMDWGVNGIDYAYNSTPCDFQDLLVAISKNRATSVESEVEPLATRISNRNTTLENLGNVLADLTKLQAKFDSEAEGDARKGTLLQTSYEILEEVFVTLDFDNRQMTKYEVEEWLQKVKSKIDALNNESEKDMSRLESLVDRRDESFSTASDLMSKVSDARSTLIGNL